MPDPTQRPELGFPEAVARRLQQMAEFGGHRGATVDQLHAAVLALQAEVRKLREAIQPTESPLITGRDAMREYRALTTPRT